MTTNYTQAPVIDQQFLDINGNPLAGGKVWTYLAGTNFQTPTYTDGTGTAQATNPIILDSGGFTQIFLATNLQYKFVVMDSSNAIQYTVDYINPTIPMSIINTMQSAIDSNTANIAILQAGSGTTITLTGAVTGSGNIASPITTTLANTSVTAGSYTNTNITVNSKGQITAAANGSAGGTGITSLTGDVTASGSGSVVATLANTAVTAGSYTSANITVDSKGRITAASSGSSGSGSFGTNYIAYPIYPAPGSKSVYTRYTNTASNPWQVIISYTGDCTIFVNDSVVGHTDVNITGAGGVGSDLVTIHCTFIVPAGWNYWVQPGTGFNQMGWVELR